MASRISPNLENNPPHHVKPPDKAKFSPHEFNLHALNAQQSTKYKATADGGKIESPKLNSLTEFPKLNAKASNKTELCKFPNSKSWKDIIKENNYHGSSIKLTYYEPSKKENIRYAYIDENLISEARKRWNNSIVFYVYGNKPYFKYLKEYIDRSWKIQGGYQLYTRENGFYIIKLNTQEDCEKVLAEGPYFYNKRLIFMKKWQPGMKLSREFLHSIPIWVQLPNLDLDFWSVEAISRIASVIGHPVKLDHITEDVIRISYARILIEIDINCSFPSEIPIQYFDGSIIWQKVIYEWIPFACSNCKTFGHSAHKCLITKVWKQKENLNEENCMEIDCLGQVKEKESVEGSKSIIVEDSLHSNPHKSVPYQHSSAESAQANMNSNNLSENEINSSSAKQNSSLQRNLTSENRFEVLDNINIDDKVDNTVSSHQLLHDTAGVTSMNNNSVGKISLPTAENIVVLNSSDNNVISSLEQEITSSMYCEDANMNESDSSSNSFKNKRCKINLKNLQGEEISIGGEPFVETNPKWINLVSQIKTKSKSKAKKSRDDTSLPGGVKSGGISKK